ncbi:HpcH/HpaI aldolase family protein [Gordonia otitidis]|uniref:2,4-dihydroxyhept-2-ene-1,7-dioic acid aldolase n=1 Tax=Gordonia otitidis (strain DSM 44809 / CCUG 52243 / JCM 12355 / NBRC 100426 / IFM 10032) TaxID=1108044 RepID=H5TLM7_GORO1|nr:aldolase/citrate lyase family protein [Gordonia otitidis]GAB34385.1 2,4-dihydroxyhept-2-ene-1,7-dioic acid aldolase [Gordonia otitidis NBRC 100426]
MRDGSNLKQRLQDGDKLLGVLVRMPSEELVEMAAVAGMDYVLIDCEHGPADQLALRAHVTAAEAQGIGTIIRVGQGEPAMVQRALDLGVEGIVMPHIDTVSDAREFVRQTHYPPFGERGFATYGRTGRFGQRSQEEHLASALDTVLTIAMIESTQACENAHDILAVDGVDGVLCGPADLAASSGYVDSSDDRVKTAIAQAHSAIGPDKLRMDIVGDSDRVRESFEAGASMVVVNLTHSIMHMLQALRRSKR